MLTIQLAIWNANGLSKHKNELQAFLRDQNIDIMLISETHFTKKNYIKFNRYNVYHTMHPDGTAHGGSAIVIKNNIKHHVINEYRTEKIQATTVVMEWSGPLTISAVYCPPKHATKQDEFEQYLKILGNRFIAGGDFNAKHPQWGSRLISPKGRELWEAMKHLNLEPMSTGEPTYWSTDRQKKNTRCH